MGLSFSVTGEYITEMVRGWMLEGKTLHSLRFLQENFGMDYGQAVSVLEGTHQLTGNSRDTGYVNLDPVPEGDEETASYLQELLEMFAGTWKRRGKFYRPYAVVKNVSWSACEWAERATGPLRYASAPDYHRQQAMYYSRNQDSDLAECLQVGENDSFFYVLFEKVEEPPFFLETFDRPQAALDDYLKYGGLRTYGGEVERFGKRKSPQAVPPIDATLADEGVLDQPDFYLVVKRDGVAYFDGTDVPVWVLLQMSAAFIDDEGILEEYPMLTRAHIQEGRRYIERNKHEVADARDTHYDNEWAKDQERRTEKVRAQVEERGGYLTLTVGRPEGDDRPTEYQIPQNAFYGWALDRTALRGLKPEWEPVSVSGLRLESDCAYHSDWMLGAQPQEKVAQVFEDWSRHKDKPFEEAASSLRYAIQRQVGGFEVPVFGGRGMARGEVYLPEIDEEVNPGTIIVIPNLSQDYYIPAASAGNRGAVIAHAGGEMSHLATVAREDGLRIILVEDEDTWAVLTSGDKSLRVEVDFNRGKLKLSHC
jgi:uncharacterized protein (DUF433 family)/phosphohistidine swiveling domain-containing protein